MDDNWLELDILCFYCGNEDEIGMTHEELGLFGPRPCSSCGETKNLKISKKSDGIDYYNS
jgi:transcription elongation factor Elf1